MGLLIKSLLMVLLLAYPAFAVTNTASAGSTWSGATWDQGHVPLAGEDVVINTGLTLAIDVARIPATSGDLASLTGNGTAQLTINPSTAVEIHCGTGTITPSTKGATGFINIATGTATVQIWGNLASVNGVGVYHNSTGEVDFYGTVIGGTAAGMHGLQNKSTGILKVGTVISPVTVTGGSGSITATGVYNTTTGTVTIYAAVTGGANGYGVDNFGTGSITIYGNVAGGAVTGAYNAGTTGGLIDIYGNVTGGTATSSFGANNNTTGEIRITGTIAPGSAGVSPSGVNNVASGQITIRNTSIINGGAGANYYGVNNAGSGTIDVTGTTITGGSAIAGYGIFNALSTGIVNLHGCILKWPAASAVPVGGFTPVYDPTTTSYNQYVAPGATTVNLAKEVAATDLKLGVKNGTITGTLTGGTGGLMP